jgi:hypothetical protein
MDCCQEEKSDFVTEDCFSDACIAFANVVMHAHADPKNGSGCLLEATEIHYADWVEPGPSIGWSGLLRHYLEPAIRHPL